MLRRRAHRIVAAALAPMLLIPLGASPALGRATTFLGVYTVSPASGRPAGGNRVTLTGSGFEPGATVSFGATAGTAVSVVSDSQLTVTAPPHPLGVVDVQVSTASATATRYDGYTYAAVPRVTGLSTASGGPAGGAELSVTGYGFLAGATVLFGSTPGRSVRVVSTKQLVVTAPPHPAGTVHVRVSTPSGTSPATGADLFTYSPTAGGALSVIAGRCTFTPPGPTTRQCITPFAVAVDAAGDQYIADLRNSRVEKVTPDGTLSVIAGTGDDGAPTPGPATSSDLGTISGLALSPAGDLYLADSENNVIERVTSDGMLSVVAGTGRYIDPDPEGRARSPRTRMLARHALTHHPLTRHDLTRHAPTRQAVVRHPLNASSAVPATSVDLYAPEGVAVDSAGNLYIADTGFNDVEKVTPDGMLTGVAGIYRYYGSPKPGPATRTRLAFPDGVALDSAGNLYIADGNNNLIEKVTPGGTLSVIAGTGEYGPPTPGPATRSGLEPDAIAADPAGNLYIADSQNSVIERIGPHGQLSIVAGARSSGQPTSGQPTPGPATRSKLGAPSGVALDPAGDLYVADGLTRYGVFGNDVVEKVTPSGTLSIAAGIGTTDGPPTPGPATSSNLDSPTAVALDPAGNLYIADTFNRVIEKLTPDGTLSIVAGTGRSGPPTPGPALASDLNYPAGLALDPAGNLYISDRYNDVVEKVTPDGTLSVVAGTGTQGRPRPGPATSSGLAEPAQVAVDSAGNLYIADYYNYVVEKVTPGGTLSVIAGDGVFNDPTRPGPATSSGLDPYGLAVDPAGNVYIASGSQILKVTPAGTLSIIAGNGPDLTPGPAISSGIAGYPSSLALDAAGNLYVAGGVIVKITPGGTLSVVAGAVPDSGAAPTPGPATSSSLGAFGVVVDPAGNLDIADSNASDVERVSY